MASGSKIAGPRFPRKRYVGDSGTKVYSTFERTKMAKLMGAAYRLHLHVRYYDRSSSGAPSVTFGFLHGCLGDEFPADVLTQIPLTHLSFSHVPVTACVITGRGGCADQPSTECWQSDPPENFESCLNRPGGVTDPTSEGVYDVS